MKGEEKWMRMMKQKIHGVGFLAFRVVLFFHLMDLRVYFPF